MKLSTLVYRDCILLSFPLRERGLKLGWHISDEQVAKVVPLAGTWIETAFPDEEYQQKRVVPLAGTWIETSDSTSGIPATLSFPLRERGLKLHQKQTQTYQ